MPSDQLLFSAKGRRRPGPKGPEKELIDAIVEMKRRNPTWGCPRIAEQIALAFGLDIDKDVVRRIVGAFPSAKGNIRSVVAYVPGAHEGQFVERGHVAL